MMKLGLTGGIATGKSTVSQYLAELGFPIIDADVIARQVVEPGQPALDEIVAAFGTGVLQSDGRLNRQALGALVFGHPDQLAILNGITHPRVQAETRRLLTVYEEAGEAMVVLDIPLLLESQNKAGADKIVVVAVDETTQRQRLMARNGLSLTEAQARIDSQMPLAEKVKLADYVVDNSGSIEQTYAQVDAILKDLALK
jgi:dephospho-CoA kinase